MVLKSELISHGEEVVGVEDVVVEVSEVAEIGVTEDVVVDMILDSEVEVVSEVDEEVEVHVMEGTAAAVTIGPLMVVEAEITEVPDTEADLPWVKEMAATGKGSRTSSIAVARTSAARKGANHRLPDLRCL